MPRSRWQPHTSNHSKPQNSFDLVYFKDAELTFGVVAPESTDM